MTALEDVPIRACVPLGRWGFGCVVCVDRTERALFFVFSLFRMLNSTRKSKLEVAAPNIFI